MGKSKYFIFDGDVFGSLIVVKANHYKSKSLVKCVCGIEKLIRNSDLMTGRIRSCGKRVCYNDFKDLIGLRFGYLTVLNQTSDRSSNGSIIWECICICGKICLVSSKHLISGATKSCGCKKADLWSDHFVLLSDEERGVRTIFNSYKRRAKLRNLEFDLSLFSFRKLINSNCHYCNVTPEAIFAIKKVRDTVIVSHNGIDRVNSNLGYIERNCVPCCQICNRAKMDLPIEEFMGWIDNLIKYRSN